ncbi:integral membrane sensor signal transduction histidine kinase [Candidatus Vecturithrix granuli]|uniref:histidine kinase n=1 Tax=Vecturithrix granuli TaxID=1499967 RepID=A0A081BY04_VECG1|nr:integral membrane sensor signal transduction histidine kinase [Candidatus Vecturithrix granuli]
MKLTDLAQQFSQTWKRLIVIVLLTLIFGSLLTYLVSQKRYAQSLEKERFAHWTEMEIFHQELLNVWEQCDASENACMMQQKQITLMMEAWFQTSPWLFRLLLLNPDGTVIAGKERQEFTEQWQEVFSSSSYRVVNYSQRGKMEESDLIEKIHILQLPLAGSHAPAGFLRGEFWVNETNKVYIQVVRVTFRIILFTTGMMILGGVFLILGRVSQHISEKQQQVEAYALTLEQVNYNLRRTKKELYISEKLASLGYLAAGIAHEIGNPLGAVLGYVELLQKNQLDSAKTKDILGRTEREVQRIRQIIQELMTFSRPNSLHLEKVDVNFLLRKILSQLPAHQEKSITMRVQLTEFPLFAEADAHKLQTAFLNILGNARDAIASEGEIRIATSRRIRETSTMLEGSEVIAIEFADNGEGIPEEHLSKIFDPFFTTKDPGSGMGLGLSLCHRIIESFHGEIEVRSTLGQGTTVTIFLPPFRKNTQGQAYESI